MTIIMPAGSKKFEWAPKDLEKETLQKTASAGAQAVEDVNPLYEAAKKFVKAQMELEVLPPPSGEVSPCEGAPCDQSPLGGVDGIGEAAPVADAIPSADAIPAEAEAAPSGVKDVAKAVQEVIEKAEKAEAVVGKVEQALDKVEQAAQEAKDAVAECKGEAQGEAKGEAKEEKPGEEVAEVEIEVEDEKKDEDDDKEEIVKESDEKPKEKTEKDASTEDTFVRFAHISPENRTKLVTYWTKYLKYPKDWVNLMVKDYEK